MNIEKDMARFDRALHAVEALGGSVRLTAWPGKAGNQSPETSADWGDISTMLRDYVKETESRITLSVIPKGKAKEEFVAKWVKAEREPYEDEQPLHEAAMDSIFFTDNSSFHFDRWSDGKPYTEVIEDDNSSNAIKLALKWLLDNVIGVVLAGLILAFLIIKSGLNGS